MRCKQLTFNRSLTSFTYCVWWKKTLVIMEDLYSNVFKHHFTAAPLTTSHSLDQPTALMTSGSEVKDTPWLTHKLSEAKAARVWKKGYWWTAVAGKLIINSVSRPARLTLVIHKRSWSFSPFSLYCSVYILLTFISLLHTVLSNKKAIEEET